ncbi:MAG: peptidase T [Oscillospiraceae bacterium]|nr:peptidase T [Oscillospiraceae bacterium]
MKAYERLINYARVHTASSDDTSRIPSTDRQFDLADLLADEMHALGFSGVTVDEHAYVYGYIPATPGLEDLPCVGFNAHIDTIPDFSGENVQPTIHENYDGGDIPLGDSGRVLSPKHFPDLNDCIGHTLITTDGTTVLGADDKAGIAEIMTAFERVLTENIPHGRITACFSPDEEVGHGAALLDLDLFGADFAYTVDGQEIEEINCETFNAASASWEIKGFNVHPGSAKNVMVNASIVAMEINAMLPAGDRPEHTEDYEGFFHLTGMQGSVARATLNYIIRDHDAAKFAARKDAMRHIEKLINEKYGAGTAVLTIQDSYRNMLEIMRHHAGIIVLAESAIRKCGLEPVRVPIRGGTDGAQLSFRGLPCPNIGTGGAGLHGPYEHISAEKMDIAVQIPLNIIIGITELR